MTPKYLILFVDSILVLSTFKAFVLHFSNCGFDPNKINS